VWETNVLARMHKNIGGLDWFRSTLIGMDFWQLVHDLKNDIIPIHKLEQALQQLDSSRQVLLDQLVISLVLRKNPEDYSQICKKSRIGGKPRLRKEDILAYYKCHNQNLFMIL
jgi:hypothetical protein